MADSEARQKFDDFYEEAYAGELKSIIDRQAAWKFYKQGMRAGEIARWIPVTERMPDGDGEYWVWLVPHKPQQSAMCPEDIVFSSFTPHAKKVRTWINKEGKRRFNCGATSFPTHWQPLPAAPEEKKPAISGAEESKK